jgi:hypothetical protein
MSKKPALVSILTKPAQATAPVPSPSGDTPVKLTYRVSQERYERLNSLRGRLRRTIQELIDEAVTELLNKYQL